MRSPSQIRVFYDIQCLLTGVLSGSDFQDADRHLQKEI